MYRNALATLAVVDLCLWTAPVRAADQVLNTAMTGDQVVPPSVSLASGNCQVFVDTLTLRVNLIGSFANLSAPPTAATLRGPAAPSANGPVMLKQSTMGATTTGNFVGSGTLAPGQVAAILGGAAYCEVDTSLFPMGEIRGQLALATFVPAVSKWHMILLAAALALVGISFPNGRTKWFKRAVTTTD